MVRGIYPHGPIGQLGSALRCAASIQRPTGSIPTTSPFKPTIRARNSQLTCAATQFQHAIARSDRQLTYQHFAGRELVLA